MAIRRVALLLLLVTYIIIVFGGYVASSESGMGCGPEWPLCNGDVIPMLEGDTLIEFVHRVIGLVLVILAGILFILVKKKKTVGSMLIATNWMVGLLLFQVIAGAFVVVLDLPPIIVTLHLLIAMLFLITLLWIYRVEHQAEFKASISIEKQKEIAIYLNVMLVLLFLTLGFGAFIKHESYGLACGWLDCGETWLPVSGPQIVQTVHRLLGIITAVYIALLTIWSLSRDWGRRIQRRLILAMIIVFVQIISGVFTVVTLLAIPWAVVHLAVGTALFIVIAYTRVSLGEITRRVHIDDWRNIKR